MSSPFAGQIMIFAGSFAPAGWAICDGRSLSVEENQQLFDAIGITYGGDGTPYFRPPYGVHNADTDRVAADLGYTTVTLWSGTIGDSLPETPANLVASAMRSFAPQ